MRSPLPVLQRSLGESWRALIGWAIGVLAVLALYLPLYPSMAATGDLQQIINTLPDELTSALGYDQIGTGAGYTQATFFGLIGFALFVIAGTGWGAAAIGGAEESGRLELDLAHGIGRFQYAAEQGAAVLVRLLVLGAFAGAVILVLSGPSELDVSVGNVVGAILALTALGSFSATVALCAGAASGTRVWGVGLGAGVAVISYVLNALANQASDLESVRAVSPYAWVYDNSPLENGASVGVLALWGIVLALVVATCIVLRRRDVVG